MKKFGKEEATANIKNYVKNGHNQFSLVNSFFIAHKLLKLACVVMAYKYSFTTLYGVRHSISNLVGISEGKRRI